MPQLPTVPGPFADNDEIVQWAKDCADLTLTGRALQDVIELARSSGTRAIMATWVLGRTEIASFDQATVAQVLLELLVVRDASSQNPNEMSLDHVGGYVRSDADGDEQEAVRNHAAEAMGELLAFSRNEALRAPAITALIRALFDETASVQYWSAFALGQLSAHEATEALTILSANENPTRFANGTTIAEEAAHSLSIIENHPRR